MIDPELRKAILERVRRIPIFETLRMKIADFSPGSCTAVVPYDRKFDGVFDSLHGGILMTVADSIACCAILTQAGVDQAMATTDMNIRFLAPCTSDVTVEAKVIKRGRTLCIVGADLHDQAGTHVAVAQISYMLLKPKK